MKKVGIITFHNSYNCGSMLESYAIQRTIEKYCSKDVRIIDFSNNGQRMLYSIWYKNNSLKNILKNIMIFPNRNKIKYNNKRYEQFKNDNFKLTRSEYTYIEELKDDKFDVIVAGSDQIWNVTIEDADDAYFLPWVSKAKKVAYAPSFGSKRLEKNACNIDKYKKYLMSFDSLSIREENGRRWLKDLINVDIPVLIDPTLILEKDEYEKLIANDIYEKDKYIFFYCPGFDKKICKYVKQIAQKYNMKVIVWSAKSYSTKLIKLYGFKLAKYENPSSYLYYIKNAELVLTTSFHGTIFSTIYGKKFITIKNGGMYGDDDRVITLLTQLKMLDRLIPHTFDSSYDYLKEVDYLGYNEELKNLRKGAIKYLKNSIGEINESDK